MSMKAVLLAGVMTLGTVHAMADDLPGSPPPFKFGEAASKPSTGVFGPAASAAALKPAASGGPFVIERANVSPQDGTSPDAAASKEVDISALRYYASQNDLARVAAEIRLLRSKHPNWEPPADLFSEVRSSVDEQPLWDLFAKHDLAGLKAAVEQIRADKPDWQPSSELMQKVQLAEAHDALVEASDAQRWSDVVDLAADNKALLACADVDALWRTAEALVHVDDEPRAIDAYRYVLANCSKPQERLATVQKASALLTTPGAVDALLGLGRRGRDGRNEFESVRLDALRRAIGEAAAGKGTTPPSAKDVEALEAAYRASKSLADAQLLGWFYYAQKNFPVAETWFRAGLGSRPEPKAAEGLVLALREQGKLQEAETTAMLDRDLAPANRQAFIQISSGILVSPTPTVTLTPEQVAAFTQAVDTEKSAEGAQALGWHLYEAKNVAEADAWFGKSMAWMPSENAAVGLMITAKRLAHNQAYADLVAKYRTQYPKVAELEGAFRSHGGGPARGTRVATRGRGSRHAAPGEAWDAGADAIVATFKAGQYDQALAMLNTRGARRAEPHGLTMVRGWAQYHRGDWAGAQQTFATLQTKAPSTDAANGLRVIQQGYLPPNLR